MRLIATKYKKYWQINIFLNCNTDKYQICNSQFYVILSETQCTWGPHKIIFLGYKEESRTMLVGRIIQSLLFHFVFIHYSVSQV